MRALRDCAAAIMLDPSTKEREVWGTTIRPALALLPDALHRMTALSAEKKRNSAAAPAVHLPYEGELKLVQTAQKVAWGHQDAGLAVARTATPPARGGTGHAPGGHSSQAAPQLENKPAGSGTESCKQAGKQSKAKRATRRSRRVKTDELD